MISKKTILFQEMVNTLTDLSVEGYYPLSEASNKHDGIYYDQEQPIHYEQSGMTAYRAVMVYPEKRDKLGLYNNDDYLVNWEYWEDFIRSRPRYSVNVVFVPDGGSCVIIECGKLLITIKEGTRITYGK